ncbi:T-complex protein 11-like protein 1 [Ctenocephalides felis]|uniref:T-complex protein 11-like protein 1 n=1 Tax=Ctenocephalides felis TaxID=7515 RepID=UPI000E6E16E8|nr:T-complex protein 11-like protein 1 [Ctenocephalides felis]XP_026468077.1 T-complex protein 11-like protein 1 [Ctenocephalides felis]
MDAPSEAQCDDEPGCSSGSDEKFEAVGSADISIRPTPLINPNDLRDRIEHGVNALKDMLIAHEITMDGEFRLKERMTPNNSLEKAITDTIKRAFWDILRSELEMTPPCYDQALRLLEDVKIGLSNAVLPHQKKLIQSINEVLDSDVIRQQATAGVLDFKSYADYVLNMMLKLCASARDERIEKLQQCTDVVQIFKEILEILDLMKLDLTNTSIQLARPDIILHSIQYEKDKFNEYVKSREGLEDCLRYTKMWLQRHVGTIEHPKTNEEVLACAYLEVIEWYDEETFPETLVLDKGRFFELRDGVVRLLCSATLYTLGLNQITIIKEVASFKQKLQSDITTLMSSVEKNEDFNNIMPNLILQIITDIKMTLEACGYSQLSSQEEDAIRVRLEQVANPAHNIRVILKQRLIEYFRLCAGSPRGPIGIDIPQGWQVWKNEILHMSARFCRLTIHNRGVFGEHYINIIEEAQKNTDMCSK